MRPTRGAYLLPMGKNLPQRTIEEVRQHKASQVKGGLVVVMQLAQCLPLNSRVTKNHRASRTVMDAPVEAPRW